MLGYNFFLSLKIFQSWSELTRKKNLTSLKQGEIWTAKNKCWVRSKWFYYLGLTCTTVDMANVFWCNEAKKFWNIYVYNLKIINSKGNFVKRIQESFSWKKI